MVAIVIVGRTVVIVGRTVVRVGRIVVRVVITVIRVDRIIRTVGKVAGRTSFTGFERKTNRCYRTVVNIVGVEAKLLARTAGKIVIKTQSRPCRSLGRRCFPCSFAPEHGF